MSWGRGGHSCKKKNLELKIDSTNPRKENKVAPKKSCQHTGEQMDSESRKE